jgi:putative membrane protein
MTFMPYGNWNMNMGWGGGLLMVLFTLIFFGAVALIIVTVLHQHDHHGQNHHGHDRHGHHHPSATHRPDALKILDERFARGQIDEEEYKSRRALL